MYKRSFRKYFWVDKKITNFAFQVPGSQMSTAAALIAYFFPNNLLKKPSIKKKTRANRI